MQAVCPPARKAPLERSASAGRGQRAAVILCLVIVESLLMFPQLKHNDFDQYWAGARLFLRHGNPYDPSALYALEKAAGSSAPRVIMLMTPPWTMPLIAPLGFFSYPMAHVLWFAAGLLMLIASAEILWACYGGPATPSWMPLVLAATFVPNLSALIDGQILPLILFSLAGFLALAKRQHPALLGFSLLGLAIKPHLTYLVTIAIVLWLIEQRRWATMAWCAAGLLGLCAATWAVAPAALSGYRAAGLETSVVVSGFGGLLRQRFGMQHYWLQFTPIIPGLLWFAWYRRRLAGWDWERHLPVLLLASITMCAYGWWYDQALLTVALIPGALAWIRCRQPAKRLLFLGFAIIAALQAATPIFSLTVSFYIWTGPALALLYFVAIQSSTKQLPEAAPAMRHSQEATIHLMRPSRTAGPPRL